MVRTDAATPASGSKIIALCVGSVTCSTGLVILNKIVMNRFGFTYVMALTTCHFGCTALFMELLKHFGPQALRRRSRMHCAACS